MKVSIVTIGDEILIGQINDTNSTWLAKRMTGLGLSVHEMVSIQDHPDHIRSTLDRLIGRTDLILMTGGLGPTKDDLTKETLATYFGGKLVINEEVLEKIRDFFEKRGRNLIESNRKQAEVPENCRPLPNMHGTAPGMWFEKTGTIVVSMPGVPYEMKPMVDEQVIPGLKEHLDIPNLLHRTIMTHGIPESYLAEMIAEWEDALPECMKLAYLPRPGIVRLRLTVTGKCAEEADSLFSERTEALRKHIGDHIFAYDDTLLEKVLGEFLKQRKLTLSTAESCTGGNLARLITSVPGSSSYFQGSVIAYSDRVKEEYLGVSPAIISKHGAVSKEVVESMVQGVCRRLHTNYAMATSGIAGPEGGTDEKPVGLVWIAVGDSENVYARKYQFGGHRELVIEQASIMAMGLLFKHLNGLLE